MENYFWLWSNCNCNRSTNTHLKGRGSTVQSKWFPVFVMDPILTMSMKNNYMLYISSSILNVYHIMCHFVVCKIEIFRQLLLPLLLRVYKCFTQLGLLHFTNLLRDFLHWIYFELMDVGAISVPIRYGYPLWLGIWLLLAS